ncbi:MAG: sugar phosphate nucleotidyltransferase [bacterium]
MKGIITAGGTGSRLLPITKITNKHLLPLYDKPMVYYPLRTLVQAGIEDIMVVTGGEFAGDFLRLLGNGAEFGLKRLHYAYQEGSGGIAAALALAEDFADGEPVAVILGDTIIEGNVNRSIAAFAKDDRGAKIFLKKVEDPRRFGVADVDGDRVTGIIEKPASPPTDLAVIGIYLYDGRVFDVIKDLEPSARGELEITDVNNQYIKWGEMTYAVLNGWWTDAGTFPSLLRASNLVAETGANKEEPAN